LICSKERTTFWHGLLCLLLRKSSEQFNDLTISKLFWVIALPHKLQYLITKKICSKRYVWIQLLRWSMQLWLIEAMRIYLNESIEMIVCCCADFPICFVFSFSIRIQTCLNAVAQWNFHWYFLLYYEKCGTLHSCFADTCPLYVFDDVIIFKVLRKIVSC
jgi:hypothetical protein